MSPPSFHVLRGYLTDDRQQEVLAELQELRNNDPAFVTGCQGKWGLYQPKGPCNLRRPDEILRLGTSALSFCGCSQHELSVVSAILFPLNGSTDLHTDKGLPGKGVSISLGASCIFQIAKQQVELCSGDALVADFQAHEHGVLAVVPGTAPSWWKEAAPEGAARCSVQLRGMPLGGQVKQVASACPGTTTSWTSGDGEDPSDYSITRGMGGMDLANEDRRSADEVKDKNAFLKVLKEGGSLQSASEDLRKDKAVVIEAVKQDGFNLQFASDTLKNDKDVVLAAMHSNFTSFTVAGDSMKADKEVVLLGIALGGDSTSVFQHCNAALKADTEVALAAITQTTNALIFAPEHFRGDKDVLMACVTRDRYSLDQASADLRADKDLVLAAVNFDGRALAAASDELKNDKEVVLAAMTQNPHSMLYVPEHFRGDKDVMMLDVAQDPGGLGLASADLKADKELVLVAVNVDGRALQHASDELKNDKEVVLAAFAHVLYMDDVFECASDAVLSDPEVIEGIKAIAAADPEAFVLPGALVE